MSSFRLPVPAVSYLAHARIVDLLPAATKIYMELPDDDEEEPRYGYEKGFALGFVGSEEVNCSLSHFTICC